MHKDAAVGREPIASIPPLFDLSLLHSQSPAEADGGLPANVRTPAQQWAYALTLPQTSGEAAASGPVLVRVQLLVTVGQVGVGCLNPSNTKFVDERLARAGSSPSTIDLVLMSAGEAASLVVRNAHPSGPSEVRVLDVQCYAIETAGAVIRTPGLSAPIATPAWSRYYGSPGETVIERYRARLFAELSAPTVVRWEDGLAVRVLPSDQLSRALYVSSTYEPNTLSVLKTLLRPGDVFFDVGANAGVMSLAAARWVGETGRVYSFEPSMREFARLVDNLALSGVTNATPVPLAVTDRPGVGQLRVAAGAYSGLNTLGERFPYEGVDVTHIASVETTSLDDFIERNGIASVAAVKLDIEGAEGAALRGAKRLLDTFRPALVVEIVARSLDANGSSVSELERLLRGAGYVLFSIDDRSAALIPLHGLDRVDEQNIVALPGERGASRAQTWVSRSRNDESWHLAPMNGKQ